MTKTSNRIYRETQHFKERIFCGASETLLSLIWYCLLAKTNPRRETAHKAMMFTHGYECVNHTAIKQAKITRIAGNTHGGDTLNQAVEKCSGEQLKARFPFATGTLCIDNFGTLFPTRNQLR